MFCPQLVLPWIISFFLHFCAPLLYAYLCADYVPTQITMFLPGVEIRYATLEMHVLDTSQFHVTVFLCYWCRFCSLMLILCAFSLIVTCGGDTMYTTMIIHTICCPFTTKLHCPC